MSLRAAVMAVVVATILLGIPGVKEADVQVVLDPPWSQTMMSDAARLQLGLM